jgi:hypothetical protein
MRASIALPPLLLALLWPSTLPGQATPRDTFYVINIPGEGPRKDPVADTAYIRAVQRGDGSWFTSQNAAYARAVEIVGVRTPGECEGREVEFLYLSNAPVTGAPPSLKVKGQWIADARHTAQLETLLEDGDLDSLKARPESRCVAVAHWRLGDSPGRHYLRARLVRKDGIPVSPQAAANTTDLFTAVAHAPPAIVAGLVLPFKEEHDGDTGEEPGEEDEESGRTVETIVGFDTPLVFGGLSPKLQGILSHFRPMVATNLSDPGEDVYLGLEIMPLLPGGGARSGANPLQFTLGWKFDNNGDDTMFFGMHLNTSGLLNDLLKAVGGS